MSDNESQQVGQTVGDLSNSDISELPEELQHGSIHLFRDMSTDAYPRTRAYQIVFDQSWMPYDFRPGDGWQIIHARTEWHKTASSLPGIVLDVLGREDPCLTIVVNDRV